MGTPVTIDVPHRLGRAEAKRRLQARVGELAGHIPGGVAHVTSGWPGEYEMALEVSAMAQHVAARLEVEETRVRVHLDLPPMLAFFSGAISSAVAAGGTRLLGSDRS